MPSIDREVLDIYRNKKGFTDQDLADASGIDDRTIRRVRREGQGSMETANRIAGALGIEVEFLINGIAPHLIQPLPKTKRRYNAIIELDVPFKQMDTQAKEEKKALLKKVIGGTSDIEILKVQDGSTILTVQMSEGDVLRLLAAMMDSELDMLRVKKIRIPDHSWLVMIIALLNYDNARLRPDQLNEETISELLTSRALEDAMKLKTRDCLICKKID